MPKNALQRIGSLKLVPYWNMLVYRVNYAIFITLGARNVNIIEMFYIFRRSIIKKCQSK